MAPDVHVKVLSSVKRLNCVQRNQLLMQQQQQRHHSESCAEGVVGWRSRTGLHHRTMEDCSGGLEHEYDAFGAGPEELQISVSV